MDEDGDEERLLSAAAMRETPGSKRKPLTPQQKREFSAMGKDKPAAAAEGGDGLTRLWRAVFDCKSTRLIVSLAVMCCLAGWAVFVSNAVYTSVYAHSHGMRGYEWLPLFAIWPFTMIFYLRWPRLGTSHSHGTADPDVYEGQVTTRLILIGIFVCVGLATGIPLAIVEWFAPKSRWVVASGARGLFTTPSPTPAPRRVELPGVPDPTAGILSLVSLGLLTMGVYLWWLYATEPEREEGASSSSRA